MKWKSLAILVGASYCLFLVVYLPATWVLQPANQAIPDSALVLSDAKGTLWQGEAQIVSQWVADQQGQLTWKIHPLKLFLGQLSFDLGIKSAHMNWSAQIGLGISTWEVRQLSGEVSPVLLNQLLQPQGISLQKPLGLSRLALRLKQVTHQQQGLEILEAEGQMHLSAGVARLATTNMGYELPDLIGQLSVQKQALHLAVTTWESSTTILAEGYLYGDGAMKLSVYQAILAAVGQDLAGELPTETLLEASFDAW